MIILEFSELSFLKSFAENKIILNKKKMITKKENLNIKGKKTRA